MELIKQIAASTTQPTQLVQQFVQTIHEHPDNIKEVLRRLFCALRAKNERHRSNVLFALLLFLRKMRSSLDLDYVYEFSKEVLLRDSTTTENRRSTIALFFAWNAMALSGVFKNKPEIIISIVRNLFGISNERICYRTIGYETIWSIVNTTYKTTEEFKAGLFEEIVGEMGQTITPPHADSFALWVKIIKKFPGLPLKKWANNPVSSGTCRSLASILENTTSILPQIHPVWTVLAEYDSNQLLHNTMELWANKKKPDGYIPMIASVAAFGNLEVQHFIQLVEKNTKYYSEIQSTKYAEFLNDALLKTAERHAAIHKHRVVAIAAAIIKCVRSNKIGKFIGTLSDGETRELKELISENQSFEINLELLWAQTRRESLEDSSLVTEIFQQTMSKLENETDRQKLIPFLSHIVDCVTGDGKHWFSLIAPDCQIAGVLVNNADTLVNCTRSILEAAQKIHEIVGLKISDSDDHIPKNIQNLDSLVDAAITLLKVKCKFCQAIGRSIANSALPYIDEDVLTKFADDPLIMIKALTNEKLSANALPLLFQKIKLLPHIIVSRPEKISINISAEGIDSALPTVLNIIRETQAKGFQIALAQMLIDKMVVDRRNEYSIQIIDEQLGDFSKSQVDLVPMFIKSSFETAKFIFANILERIRTNNSPAFVKRARGWFEEVIEKFDLPSEEIGSALANFVAFKYDDNKRSDRKKAEDALGWLFGILSMLNPRKEIPLDAIQPHLEKFTKSKSRDIQLIVQSLTNSENVAE